MNVFPHILSAPGKAGRHTTLDASVTPGSRKSVATPARKADPEDERRFLEKLVSEIGGRNLASIVPMVQGIPAIIGTDLTGNQFQYFLEGFRAALTELGLTGGSTPSLAVRHRAADEPTPLASAMGEQARTRLDVSRAVRKFDEFAAAMTNGTFAEAAAAGMADGLPPGAEQLASALFAALRASVLSVDTNGVVLAASDFGSLVAAIAEATQGVSPGTQATQRSRRHPGMKMVGKNHWVIDDPDYVPVRKATNQVKGIVIDGEAVPVRDVEFADGKPIRKRRRV